MPTPTPLPTRESVSVVATVLAQEGTPEYMLAEIESWYPTSSQGSGVGVGDRIRTGEGTEASVEFLDGSILILKPQTEIEIQAFTMTTEGDRVVTRVGRVALIQGDISGDVREDLVYPPSVFEIVTSSEIVKIRGTLTE